jgi:hypothetical protein
MNWSIKIVRKFEEVFVPSGKTFKGVKKGTKQKVKATSITMFLQRPEPPHYQGYTIILRHTTFGKTPLDDSSARRRDPCLTTHNTHKRKTSMPPEGFEPAIPAS